MNAFKPFIGFFILALMIWGCGPDKASNEENNRETSKDTIEAEKPAPTPSIDPIILGIWKMESSAINGQMINFQAGNSGLKTWTFKEDGTFEEHQVIENEMVVGNGSFQTVEERLFTSIETDEEPLVVNYSIELLSKDSLVVKGTGENAAFTFYYIKAE